MHNAYREVFRKASLGLKAAGRTMVSYNTMNAEQAYTVNGLRRWCCNDPSLPPVTAINELHVYDFDNTIFQTPLPNRSLWDLQTWSRLQNPDMFVQGGWWHDVTVLAATGQGIDIEEKRAWEGYWNEKIVELIRISMQQPDVLTVLLTGRAEGSFASLIQRICKSKQLEFNIYALKPLVSPTTGKAPSTMSFKQEFLSTLMRTYSAASALRLYEDRVKHVKDFQTFFSNFSEDVQNNLIPRIPIDAEVIQVSDLPGTLDPLAEVAAIQKAVNEHNDVVRSGEAKHGVKPLSLQKTTLYTAYQIKSKQDSERLLSLVKLPETAKTLANSILITTYPANDATLQKAGGIGKKLTFEVVSVGFLGARIWACQVRSIGAPAFTTLSNLLVVLALNDGGRPHESKMIKDWHPLPPNAGFQFDAVVSDVFRLAIKEELPAAHLSSAPTTYIPQKRRHDFSHDTSQQNNSNHNSNFNGHRNTSRGNYAADRSRGGTFNQTSRGSYSSQPRGSSSRGTFVSRGRGRGNRDVSGRRPSYRDHDAAQGPGRAGTENNIHNDY